MVATLVQQKRYSLEEYFALEERATDKHEYHNGKIITMAGGSIPHNKIKTNIIRALDNWIEEQNLNLLVLDSDTKVRIEKFNRNVYPDAVVVCEEVLYWKNRDDIIVNPVLVFEVMSDSTGEYDKEGKFAMYRTLPSFREYVLINQYKPWVQAQFMYDPGMDLWDTASADSLEKDVVLRSIGFSLPLSKVYQRVPGLQGKAWKG